MKITVSGMRLSFFILIVTSILHAVPATAQVQPSITQSNISNTIIPRPLSYTAQAGNFIINKQTAIVIDADNSDLKSIAEQLADRINRVSGFRPAVSTSAKTSNVIILTTKNASDTLGDEGYSLNIRPSKTTIAAPSAAGVFYGTESLSQLLPAEASQKNVLIAAADIVDKPRFSWRGLMLDVGRYFYSKDFLKKFIDNMARHKLNTFHWHLTEDHGWRIEIKKYPCLTDVAARREGTQYDLAKHQVDRRPHWGYYTQEDVREVIEYARKKYVTIVPEIEMPGHTLAALVCNPHLSCTGGPFKMPVNWAIQEDIYCAGNEQTFTFLEDVLSEVAALFPSEIIHIGGDEAPKTRWKACARCQARIKENGLKDEHELQSYFIKRIEKFLAGKGKRIIGWDEILEGGLAPNAWVMSWRGTKGGIAAAKEKHNVVMTPTQFMYLDYYQGEPYLEPVSIGGFLPLEKVYTYEPVPEELSTTEAQYVRGVQGNVWSEYIHSPDKVEYMTFPRAAAVAEIGWTAASLKSWDDFLRRMEYGYKRYEADGINYSKSAYQVRFETSTDSVRGVATVELHTDSYKPEIRYTTDGSEPTVKAQVYKEPFTVKMPVTVKAATFRNGKPVTQRSVLSIVPPAPATDAARR